MTSRPTASRAGKLASLLSPASSLTLPSGFRFAGVVTGVKKPAKDGAPQLDLALVHSTAPCTAAATFTTNLFQAAPVKLSRALLTANKHTGIHSVVINAGCANACTGAEGDKDARIMVDLVSSQLGTPRGSALVMSTGVIGQRLKLDKIERGIAHAAGRLGTSGDHVISAARAIMTTDTWPKYLTRQLVLPESKVLLTLAGVCKGAGMIHPRMACHYPTNQATMLGLLATDLHLPPQLASELLDKSVNGSFNAVSVDGDTSTNDTVMLLANGQAPNAPKLLSGRDTKAFEEHLNTFTRDLASRLVWDGEGATKFVAIRVGSHDASVSKAIAATIATSPLVKTAMYGQDANWGRVLCAVGYADVPKDVLRPELVSLKMRSSGGEIVLVERGVPRLPMDEAKAAKVLEADEIEVVVDMGTGDQWAEYFTCDFSDEYVHINADYRS